MKPAPAALAFLLSFGTAGVSTYAAGPTRPMPSDTVKALLEMIREIGALDASHEKERSALEKKAVASIAIDEVSAFIVGAHWASRSDGERKRFASIFGELLEKRAFAKAGTFFSSLEPSFDHESIEGSTARVGTSVVQPKEGRIAIEYRLALGKDRWRITDVLLDGVSMRTNLRSQIQKILAKDSFESLLGTMQKKLTSEES